ncbi:DNA-binding response regulator [Halomonas cupida]|uniref:Phosphate regulon transcriptional regulatory protein PhoB n=1 Tax=Halomonas cupida TaxID=44933 RepID=A0A1M7CNL3_9GAMM|nr:response regulator transcription factor [Halomonas cupida]GEN26034.1 DNA-binding response regulator [Halomonas cupida]SHL68782.1 DNA-binding response regulator, OmpR family, contains REC and winged-helix (wHTH) domain [Halomonas cupida]
MQNKRSILCVEDAEDIGHLLTEILESAGHSVEWVSDGKTALGRWQKAALIILDLTLPDIDGLEVCREIRARDSLVPLIMLTARAATRDVVEGFELGADDYITKPFDADILLARVQALLRRHAQQEHTPDSAPIHVGDLEVDVANHRATLKGQPLSLTAREFALLAHFARHPGRGFSRGDLLDVVWGPEFDGFDHTVNTHINRLRGKIETDPRHPRYILTVWGVGYRFTDEAEVGEAQ